MSDFRKVKMNNYIGEVDRIVLGQRTPGKVVIIAESIIAATEQLERFVAHLNEDKAATHELKSIGIPQNLFVTYTEAAWEQLKASEAL